MASVAELKAIATLDGKQFDAEVRKMGASTGGFASKLGGLKSMIAGAFGVGAIIAFGRKLLQTADDLKTTADTFGITVDSIIALKSAMAASGINADKMMRIFGKVTEAVAEGAKLTPTAVAGFRQMGIEMEEIVGLKMDEVFELLARKYAQAADKQEFLNGTIETLGLRIGPQLIEVLQRIGAEGLDRFREQTATAAAGIDALAKASDQLEKFGNDWVIFGGHVVGALNEMIDAIAASIVIMDEFGTRKQKSFFDRVVGFFKEHPEFIKLARAIGIKPISAEERRAPEKPFEGTRPFIPPALCKKLPAPLMPETPERKAALKKLEEDKFKAGQKFMDAELRADERRMAKEEEFNRDQDKIAEEFAEKKKDIEAGKGIEVPERARVDALQAIGGLIGGVAGRGDQAARIAERTAKASEAMEKLVQDTNRKIDELNRKLDGIID